MPSVIEKVKRAIFGPVKTLSDEAAIKRAKLQSWYRDLPNLEERRRELAEEGKAIRAEINQGLKTEAAFACHQNKCKPVTDRINAIGNGGSQFLVNTCCDGKLLGEFDALNRRKRLLIDRAMRIQISRERLAGFLERESKEHDRLKDNDKFPAGELAEFSNSMGRTEAEIDDLRDEEKVIRAEIAELETKLAANRIERMLS